MRVDSAFEKAENDRAWIICGLGRPGRKPCWNQTMGSRPWAADDTTLFGSRLGDDRGINKRFIGLCDRPDGRHLHHERGLPVLFGRIFLLRDQNPS